MRREVPQEKKFAFKLLIDLSSSMKKENKAINALKALLLFCETLDALNMPFSISAFSDNAGIRDSEVSQLGQAFLRVVESYLTRAWSEV
jgi:nitric oxide reductase activation protein